MENIKIPPHSQEAEQSVIGAILILDDTDSLITEIMDSLRPDMFYSRSNQIVFKAITNIKSWDLITVTEELERTGDLDEAGGFVYVGDMAKNTPSAANAMVYVQIIKDRYIARQILSTNYSAAEQIYNKEPNRSVAEFMIRNIKDVDDSGTYKPVHIKTHIEPWIQLMDKRLRKDTGATGIKTGITALDDQIIGLGCDWLIVLAGRPSMGKTKIAQLIGGNVAFQKPVQFFSMEMSDIETMDRVIGIGAGITPKSLKLGTLTDYEWQRTSKLMEAIENDEYNMYLDSEPTLTLSQVRQRAKAMKKADSRLGLIMIDYMELMEYPDADRDDLRIGELIKGLKRLSREIKVPIMLLAQANRGADDKKRPSMSNLYGSSAIEKNADLIMFVHCDEVNNPDTKRRGVTELIQAKFRHGDPLRDVYLKKDPDDCGGRLRCMSPQEMHAIETEEQEQTTKLKW